MAIYKNDIVDINLETGNIHRAFLNRAIGMTDNVADHFGVRVWRNGEAVSLSGVSVQGYFRDPRGNNIAITSGNIVSGNEAVVILPQACYNYEGQFCLAIKLVGGGVTGTMRIVDGVVSQTNTGGAVAPTGAVPTYQEVLAVYEDMVDALEDYDDKVEEQDGKINDLKSALVNTTGITPEFDFVDGKYYDTTDGATITVGSPSNNSSLTCAYCACSEGDVITFSGWNGFSSPKSKRPWCFVDVNGSQLQKAGTNDGSYSNYEIIAPANTAYVVVNLDKTAVHRLYKGRLIPKSFDEVKQDQRSIAYAIDEALFGATGSDFPMLFEGGTYIYVSVGSTLTKYYGGGYNKTRKVLKSTTFNAPVNVTLTAKTGYQMNVYTASSGVITVAENGLTSKVLKAGEQYGIILRSTAGTDDISGIATENIIDISYESNIDKLSDDTIREIVTRVGGENVLADVYSSPRIYDGYQIRPSVGTNIASVNKSALSNCMNYYVDVAGYDRVKIWQYSTTGKFGSAFIDADGVITGTIVNNSGSVKDVIVEIPTGTKYLIASIIGTTKENPVTLICDFKFSTSDSIQIGLHTQPKSDGVLNAIKNARQITDIKYTPLAELPRSASLSLDSYAESGSQSFEDKFLQGVEYSGIPYGDLDNKKRLVGTNVSFDTFMSAMSNSGTIEYEESEYEGIYSSYYCCACTGLVAYALNTPYIYSTYYSHFYGMESKFKLVDNGVRHTLEDIELCDVLHVDGHCVMVTDIIRDNEDEIYLIEISEETTRGNTNRDLLGTQYGGKGRRLTYTTEEIYTIFQNYTVYRYSYLDSVKYHGNAYVPMTDEGKRIENPYFPVLPYRGTKCIIDDTRECTLLIESTGYTHVAVTKNGSAWNENGTTDPYTLNGQTPITITCDDEEAVYTARLQTYNNGTLQYQTRTCEWYIMRGASVTYSISSNKITFTVETTRNEFVPWFTNIRDDTTVHGYNQLVFDNYTVTNEDDKYQYTFEATFSGTAPTKYLIGMKSDVYGSIELFGTIS